jgi:hypothetical protein
MSVIHEGDINSFATLGRELLRRNNCDSTSS